MEKAVRIVGGIMGCGIAEVAARSGCDVVLREVNEALVEASVRRLETSLDTACARRTHRRSATTSTHRFTDRLEELSGCDLVVEAVVEDLDVKTEIFAALGKIVRPDARRRREEIDARS